MLLTVKIDCSANAEEEIPVSEILIPNVEDVVNASNQANEAEHNPRQCQEALALEFQRFIELYSSSFTSAV
jgi:hypothetical protein